MNKAYDVQALIEKARAKGGPDAEKLLKANFEALTEWLEESSKMTDTPYDDMAVAAGVSTIKPVVMKALDQIDGVVAA